MGVEIIGHKKKEIEDDADVQTRQNQRLAARAGSIILFCLVGAGIFAGGLSGIARIEVAIGRGSMRRGGMAARWASREWAILVFTIALVLILEGLNTSIEAVVDLASPEIHPLAKAAKDLAAAMVLIGAGASAVVGLLILGPALWVRIVG